MNCGGDACIWHLLYTAWYNMYTMKRLFLTLSLVLAFDCRLDAGAGNRPDAPMVCRWTTMDGLPENSIRSISRSADGYLWIDTPLGTARFDGVRFVNYLPKDNPAMPPPPEEPPTLPRLPGYNVSCALVESNDVVWVGTEGDGLLRLRPRLVEMCRDTAAGENGRFVDSSGRAWTVDAAGDLCVESSVGGTRRIGAEEGFMARHVTSFAETPDGTVWVGSNGTGLWRVSGGRARRVSCLGNADGEFVSALFCDREGALWIGTRGDTIMRLKGGKAKAVRFSRLSGAQPLFFCEYPAGRIWLETEKMIFSFAAADFMSASWSGAGCRTDVIRAADGYAPMKGMRAKIRFAEYQRLVAAPRPRVLIETSSPPKPFPPDTDEVLVSYTSDCPGQADRVTFSVRLSPIQKHWRYVQNTRRQVYENLRPGRYRFEVRARLPFGDWGETTTLSFEVAPHFYETAAFRCGGVAALMALVFLVVRAFYVRRLRARMDVVRQRSLLAAERARIARDIHDDIGARLTRISMLAGVAGESGGRLAEVAEDVRDVVRALDEVVWALEPRNDTLSSFVDYLYDYAESYTESAGLRLRADIPIELQDLPMSSKVRHAVYLCVKEALNNVVKHSGARTAFVAISVSRVDVRVSVGDDGEGFANPRRGGNGIANMRERMERIGGEFEIGQRTGGGCEVVFLFNLAWGMT